jgi:hypothetical protein
VTNPARLLHEEVHQQERSERDDLSRAAAAKPRPARAG